MLYHLLFPLRDYVSGFNVIQYISFRVAGAAITALLISFIVGPWVIRMLVKYKIGEEIRADGPPAHLAKKGTPTMGGIIILAAILIPTLLWANLTNRYVQIIFFATMWMGLVGWLDDYLKAVRKFPKGLVARYKLIGQITLGLLVGGYIYFSPEWAGIHSNTSLPFFKNWEIDFGIFYIPVVILVITGTSNAVNITDGLDGLASGLMSIAALTFLTMAYVTGNAVISDYLYIMYLPGSGELSIYLAAMAGATIGFLWFNARPAQVFMGDTGALALGGALGTVAILIKKEILLLIVGAVFVAEVLSVMAQVSWYKYTYARYGEGRRLFLMAPLHHHFELKGWKESKVVVRFWIIGILAALVSLATFKLR